MSLNLNNRHVVITGGSRGIGAALAREVVSKGARVTLVARSMEPLKTLAEELGGTAIALDLADPQVVEGAIDRIENAAGPIDVLINNAALLQPGVFVQQTAASIRLSMETNLLAPMELCRQLVPRMLERKQGSIVMISSVGGLVATRNVSLYGTSKAGLNQFTAILQRELKNTPVNTLLVLLGVVQTELADEGIKDKVIAAFAKRGPPPMSSEHVARKIITAVAAGQHTLCVPSYLALFHGLRQIPTRLIDLVMTGIP